jgi:alpha-beta hydrolase superfamily lysophospholipase
MTWFFAAAVIVLLAAHVTAAVYLADSFTRARRRRVEGTPADLGLRYEEVQFGAADGTQLLGWFMESPGARATVVLVHDVDGTRADRAHGLMTLQRDYLHRGMNVLAFDLRGRGESAGMRDTLGAREIDDVAAAVRFAHQRVAHLPVVLHGFGLGGSLAIVSAARGLDVDLVIADSPFTSARAYLHRRWRGIPQPTFSLALRLARQRFDADPDAVQPLVAVAESSRVPVLFIHGEADRIAPVSHSLNIAAASLNPKNEVWRVPAVGHCTAYRRVPDAYMRHCLEFIERALPSRRASVAAAS